jgi:hypothetical protein
MNSCEDYSSSELSENHYTAHFNSDISEGKTKMKISQEGTPETQVHQILILL